MASPTVSVVTPLRQGLSSAGVNRLAEQELNSTSNRLRILLVGDDPLMLRALDRLLRKAGYAVGIGARSVDHPAGLPATEYWPDVALTIVDAPDEWARVARGQPAIAHQPHERNEDRILWITNAADAVTRPDFYLVKPFTASQLLSKVDSVLNQLSSK